MLGVEWSSPRRKFVKISVPAAPFFPPLPPDTPDTEICIYNNMVSKKAHFVDFREKNVPVGRLHDVTGDLELG